jgi:hypothetical protein
MCVLLILIKLFVLITLIFGIYVCLGGFISGKLHSWQCLVTVLYYYCDSSLAFTAAFLLFAFMFLFLQILDGDLKDSACEKDSSGWLVTRTQRCFFRPGIGVQHMVRIRYFASID